jgi:hypothetical protein
MAKNGTINKTTFTDTSALTDTSELKVKAIHVTELQTALEQLTAYGTNVDNCGNCTFCQTCQKCQTCQGCQSQKCQSSSCQTCQSISQCSSRN